MKELRALLDVKSIVTLVFTGVFAYVIIAEVEMAPAMLALFSASYGSILTFFFTKKSKSTEPPTV